MKALLIVGAIGLGLYLLTKDNSSSVSATDKRKWLIQYYSFINVNYILANAFSTMTDAEIDVWYTVAHDYTAKGLQLTAALLAAIQVILTKYNLQLS